MKYSVLMVTLIENEFQPDEKDMKFVFINKNTKQSNIAREDKKTISILQLQNQHYIKFRVFSISILQLQNLMNHFDFN